MVPGWLVHHKVWVFFFLFHVYVEYFFQIVSNSAQDGHAESAGCPAAAHHRQQRAERRAAAAAPRQHEQLPLTGMDFYNIYNYLQLSTTLSVYSV